MAKVYFCRFTDKTTKKVFYKFGHTKYADVLKRFDTQFDERYGHFDIKCVASIAGDLHWCIEIEELFKTLFPKNIWLEEFFNDERTWDEFSGITEIVELNENEYARICKAFYKLKAIRYGQK
jgi:hypothetical protein